MARGLPRRRSPEERSRRRFVRRQWARRWVTWRYVAVLLAVVLVVGGGLYAVYGSSAFEVRDVEVTGTRSISEDEVRCVADVPTGGPLATLDLDGIERRVGAVASIASVEVTRSWPHSVVIDIEERTPVALIRRRVDATGPDDPGCVPVKAGEFRALDTDGVPFGSYRRAPDGLPIIQGADGATVSDTDTLAEAVAVAAALPAEVAALVDHLEIETIDRISLVLDDGRVVRWGSSEASAEKAEVILALLQRRAAVYDVSVPALPTTSGTVG